MANSPFGLPACLPLLAARHIATANSIAELRAAYETDPYYCAWGWGRGLRAGLFAASGCGRDPRLCIGHRPTLPDFGVL